MFAEMMASASGGGEPTLAKVTVSGTTTTFTWDYDADYVFVWIYYSDNTIQLTVGDCNTARTIRYGYGTTFSRTTGDTRFTLTKRSFTLSGVSGVNENNSYAIAFKGSLASF